MLLLSIYGDHRLDSIPTVLKYQLMVMYYAVKSLTLLLMSHRVYWTLTTPDQNMHMNLRPPFAWMVTPDEGEHNARLTRWSLSLQPYIQLYCWAYRLPIWAATTWCPVARFYILEYSNNYCTAVEVKASSRFLSMVIRNVKYLILPFFQKTFFQIQFGPIMLDSCRGWEVSYVQHINKL